MSGTFAAEASAPPARPQARRTADAVELRDSEIRHLRASLREESRRRMLAEQALVAQREQHARELARASRLSTTGEMAAALAHQLGQPLAATLNYLHGCQLRLAHGHHDPATLEQGIREAIAHAEEARSIVGHVRSFVAHHVPEARPTDLHALIRQTLSLLDSDCRRHGVGCALALDAASANALVDPLEIRQVMLNLVRNAIEAMALHAGPRRLDIETRVAVDGRRIVVTVADSGPGIAAADLQRIFERWYTSKRDGLGLGLSVCRSIVESHGGSLRVQRSSAGGAAFSFDLCLVEPT